MRSESVRRDLRGVRCGAGAHGGFLGLAHGADEEQLLLAADFLDVDKYLRKQLLKQ